MSEQLSTEWIDRLVAAGRILERYEDPRLRPLSKENFSFYDSARREIASIKERFSDEPDGRLAKAAELLREVRAYDSHRDNTLACEYTAEGWIKERDEWLASFSTTKEEQHGKG